MFCTNCGNKIKEETFCSNCGKANVAEPVENLESSEKVITKDKWWIRLLKVLYIVLYLTLLLIIPIVWSVNTESCYSYSCSGSTGQAFWYSLLTLIIYMVIIRLIKLATMYVAMGQKPKWKKEFKKFF